MEFISTNSIAPPKNLYPCLATISIHPHGEKSRRLSTSSRTSGGDRDDGEENVLKRIASGGRRRSDAAERRKSLTGSGAGLTGEGGPGAMGIPDRGTWYWRVQAGVTDNALVLLPLTQPPNPVLTSPPMPLSQAMPAHAAHTHGHEKGGDDEGLVDKVKNLFRRGSHQPVTTADHKAADQTATTTGTGTAATAGTGNDKVIDQTAGGEQLPSAKANAAGATNVNANAEMGWPGMINGDKLQMIAVPVHTIEKGKVGLNGGKKGDGYYITIPVTSHFAAMVAGFSDSGPTTKSGVLKLEFDKDWIGAKAESELLHHQLTMILDSERAPAPQAPLQLGSNAHGTAHPGQMGAGTTGAVGGGEAASVASGRKVPGEL